MESDAHDENQLILRVKYDENKVEKIELVTSDKQTVSSSGYSSVNGKKSVYFDKPNSPKVKLRVHYRETFKPVIVKIDL